MKECCRDGQATDDNIVQAHCMLDTLGYKHTLLVYIILIVFFTAAIFA